MEQAAWLQSVTASILSGSGAPYPLVPEGKWTLEKMMSLASGVHADLDGNGKKDIMDLYGYSSHAIQADPYYFTSGLKITERDENDIPF